MVGGVSRTGSPVPAGAHAPGAGTRDLRRRAILLGGSAAVLAGLAGSQPARPEAGGPGADPAGDVQVFYVPHQDDEVLTLGAPLLQAIRSGAEVHCVLLTQGSGSGLRHHLVSQGWLGAHVEVFAAARIREFRAALDMLGLPWTQVHLRGLTDPSPAKSIATEVRWGVQHWPEALHHTMSWRDPHPDHHGAGLALNDTWRRDRGLRVRFWQYPIHRHRYPISATTLPVPARVVQAAEEYAVWDPTLLPPERSVSHEPGAGGRYSIGWRSAQDGFEAMQRRPPAWFRWHGPSLDPVRA